MTKVPRSLVVLVVLCILAAAAVGVTLAQDDGDGQATIVADANTTNYLSPDDASGEEYQRVTMDVSSAATVAAQEIHTEHASRTFERRLQSVDSESATAQQQLETIRDRFTAIDQRQRALFNRYSSGEITSDALLRELIALQVAIDSYGEFLERTEEYANPSDQFRIRLETLVDAVSVEQPVTDRLQEALVGADDPVTIYLQSGEDTLVLAMVEDEVHIRQATLLDERDVTGDDQFGGDLSPGGYSEAQQRMEQLYPWAYSLPNLQIGGSELSVYSQIYQLGLDHPHGELTAYFDGATRNVFHENQYLPVSLVPTETTLTNTTGAGTVEVTTTRETGPLRVTVSDEVGTEMDAVVEIDGQVVGTTGADGTLWTVQPTGQFDVTATTPTGRTVSVSVSPEP